VQGHNLQDLQMKWTAAQAFFSFDGGLESHGNDE
jgi:hypothetical protein